MDWVISCSCYLKEPAGHTRSAPSPKWAPWNHPVRGVWQSLASGQLWVMPREKGLPKGIMAGLLWGPCDPDNLSPSLSLCLSPLCLSLSLTHTHTTTHARVPTCLHTYIRRAEKRKRSVSCSENKLFHSWILSNRVT